MGKQKLELIISKLEPTLYKEPYVFTQAKDKLIANVQHIFALVREKEGTTLVMTQNQADQEQLRYTFLVARISLSIATELELVGLTALFSNVLAKAGISCNVIAGYHHDHLFVPFEHGEQALTLVQSLQKQGL